ncbi:MAG: hypothetical protein AAFR38_09275 [Planctomycetota bacterium]
MSTGGGSATRDREDRLRLLENTCFGCGYDLTGLTDDVCPECGRTT